ncbi:MAG: dehypoxanthine futalosine cyclase [Kiritimatiellae bacterium]|nr:dehypoxanthine futalosine cyclase [Kiritimatiellia bacterium]
MNTANHTSEYCDIASRLTKDEALRLLKSESLPALMAAANTARRKRHGSQTFFVHSLNINPTNRCENKCDLCAFWREDDAEDAYGVTLEDAREKLQAAAGMALTDLHIVGGLAPEFDLAYHEALFRMTHEILPGILIQGLTAVEIHYLASQAKLSITETLMRLKEAGLGAIPGGGAEIFDDNVRHRICENKISGQQWLDVHREAHAIGLPTNATMLFGHYETAEHLIDHMARLRALQDETGGFQAFIPLPFHPDGTQVELNHGPMAHTIARVVAVARLFLDNVPHIRVLANYVDRKLLQVLTHGGVDDVGGTSVDERIAKAAGADTDQRFCSEEDLAHFIRSSGLKPIRVNSIYERGTTSSPDATLVPKVSLSNQVKSILERVKTGERIHAADAITLHDHAPLHALGEVANQLRKTHNNPKIATFVMDRNLSICNECEIGCRFCAFHVAPGAPGAFTLSTNEIVNQAKDAEGRGATQILLQGGVNPELDLNYFANAFSAIKQATGLWIHSLSPTEIRYLATRHDLSVGTVLERLREAGLDSLPGGGAEILVDRVRQDVSPQKISADDWINVMRTAQKMGMSTTATMVYGLGETTAERVEHLMRIRALQDETRGFLAFIPWSFQPNRTQIEREPATVLDYLRIVALARIILDNVPHLQAGWVTEGPDVAQLALSFGADDFGGVLMEEKVVKATGVGYHLIRDDVIRRIHDAGLTPVQRDTLYHPLN